MDLRPAQWQAAGKLPHELGAVAPSVPLGGHIAAARLSGLHVWDTTSWATHANKQAASEVVFVDDTTLLALHHVWSYRYSTTLERSERIDVPESVSGAVLTASGELLVYGHDDQGRPQLTLRDPGTLQLLGQCPLDGSARSPAAA